MQHFRRGRRLPALALALALMLAPAKPPLQAAGSSASPTAAPANPSRAAPAQTNTAPLAELNDEAQRIYQKHGDAIYQIQVIDLASGKKTAIGSGFQFTADGMTATNYHVVADAVQRPENNRLEYIHDKHGKGDAEILIADVLYDLAILRMKTPGETYVELGRSQLPKGMRLFSLGNPHDIGFTIVEGTYNGLSRESFIDKIHFSGAINPGMSGGPVLGHDGRVVGINVATAGNQIGFLVPVEPLRDLLVTYLEKPEGYDFVRNADREIQSQLLAGQSRNIGRLLEAEWESMPFGPLSVPGRINNVFKCWGGPAHKEKDDYTHYRTSCSTEHGIFLDERFSTGTFSYRYDLLRPKEEMNSWRFYNLYGYIYMMPLDIGLYYNVREQDATNFACNNSFLDIAGHRWRASFCVRRYKKYPAVHDVHLYLALLGEARTGLLISFAAQGVPREEGLSLIRHFLQNLRPEAASATPAAGSMPPQPPLQEPPPRGAGEALP